MNKFRGDKTILDPGVEMLEELAHIPVVGVAPYLQIQVEDEDSLTERFTAHGEIGAIDIAVIRLPRISNFTDFNAFECMEGVSLRYVSSPRELKDPDMIILPGTKNTMDDLLWMRESGMEAAVLKHAAKGKVVFGICGGYQMMGEHLSDPLGVEAGGEIRGMGLLHMDTVFEDAKSRTRVKGNIHEIDGVLSDLSGVEFEGYEIHMGATTWKEGTKVLAQMKRMITKMEGLCGEKQWSEVYTDGAYSDNIYGSYVHGIFDKEEVAEAVIKGLGRQKGIDTTSMTGVDFQAFKESQYDILADALRKHMDMDAIYKILEEGI